MPLDTPRRHTRIVEFGGWVDDVGWTRGEWPSSATKKATKKPHRVV
jgi:hypothetical protein